MTVVAITRSQAKARARQIRAQSAGRLSLAAALEHVAKELGYKSWNVASARLSNAPETPWQVGDRVSGQYLQCAFNGRIHAVRELQGGQGYELTLHFDEPVDVVKWESFSGMRQRVHAMVSPDGISWNKTSDGVPHIILHREGVFAV